ncbi:MAG TPA: Hsp20/alpha crystallin family protein [Allosphingosinicella sp.]|nr:Hsp20/alpha crystallin family protein [Allosphingosinicella sp.]
MAMRDLIPWGRQENRAPTLFGNEERSPFLSLRRDIDRLFEDFFQAPMPGLGRGSAMPWPTVEVSRTDSEVRITAEVPGMSEKDVELLLEDGILTLRGEKKSESEDRERGYSERFYGRFERRIALPSGVDEEKAKAEFRDGVLSVTLPLSREAESGRRIPINAATRH